jgi:hypothetical protein
VTASGLSVPPSSLSLCGFVEPLRSVFYIHTAKHFSTSTTQSNIHSFLPSNMPRILFDPTQATYPIFKSPEWDFPQEPIFATHPGVPPPTAEEATQKPKRCLGSGQQQPCRREE